MNKYSIVFSPRARDRLSEMAEYLNQQNLSRSFILDYLKKIENWLQTLLGQFPESGTPLPEFGKDVRRVVYQQYSFLYRVKGDVVEILTLYRENLP